MSQLENPELQEIWQTIQSNQINPTETMRPTIAPSSQMSIKLPDKGLPDLEPMGLLGEGGMGQVQLVRQRSLERQVALKKLKPSQKMTANIVGLLQEARRTGLLEHPNIIPVHSVNFDDEGSPAIVMKRVEGVSWRKLIQDPEHTAWLSYPDKIGRHLEILTQVCNAVHFAHSHGIIHRDIKPENVMIGSYGEVYLLDWGVSLRLKEDEPTKEVVGTLSYIAPEMLQGSAKVCPQTDVYLLGASLHEALTKETRHRGASLKDVMLSAFQSKPYSYPESVPAELAEICNKSMHLEIKERYESALAMREALASFLKHRSSIDLSEAAQERLKEAKDISEEKERHKLYKLFTESRFGFEQALRLWPENKSAQQGLLRCLQEMFDYELSQRNIVAAEALLSDIYPRDEARNKQLTNLKETLEGEQREQRRLAELGHQLDLSVSQKQRMYFSLGMVGFIVLLSVIFILLRYVWASSVDYPIHITASVATVGFLWLLVLIGRDSLLKTSINRRTIYSFLTGASAVPVMRIFGMSLKIPIEAIMTCELLMMGAASCILGFTVQRGFFLCAIPLLGGSVFNLIWPQFWLQSWMASYFIFALVVTFIWRRRG